MVHFINSSSQNITAAWPQVEAGTGAVQTTVSTSISTTTSEVFSATFTFTNAHICDGFLLHCKRIGAGTGTVTVALNNGTSDQQTVIINGSDIPTNLSWIFFKFGSTVTGDGGTGWKVGIKSSSAGNAQFNGPSSSDFAHLLRLTSTASPAANDQLWVVSELTGAGTSNLYTVTMNSVSSSPSYGDINICYKGTMTYGTTASTNYYLQLTGTLWLWDTATLNIGTSGTPIPSTGSAILEFNASSAAQYGLEAQVNSTVNAYGNALTFVQTKLTADAAASATSLTTADSTGWLSSDTIALASTTRTTTDSESKALTANASGTTLTIAAITNARSGTSPTQAELGNLTRNVKIRGVSAANTGYVNVANFNGGSYTSHYVEYTNLGSSSSLKTGIDTSVSTGTFDFQYNSVHDSTVSGAIGVNLTPGTSATTSSVNVSNNVFYNISSNFIALVANGSTTIDNNLLIKNAANAGLNIGSLAGVITNNTVVSSVGDAISITHLNQTGTIGTFSGNVAHSNSANGFGFSSTNIQGTMSSLTAWRNNTNGLSFLTGIPVAQIAISTGTFFGNATSGINFIGQIFNVTFSSIVCDGKISSGDTLTQPTGLTLTNPGGCYLIYFHNSTFGSSFAHTQDINVASSFCGNVAFHNCLFNSGTIVGNQINLVSGSTLGSSKHQQTAGSHICYKNEGTIQIDTTNFDATPAERLTCNTASNYLLQSGYVQCPVANTGTLTVKVQIRADTTYVGNNPRVILKKNAAIGISSDTVLDTLPNSYMPGGGNQGLFYSSISTTAAATDDGTMVFFVDCGKTDGTQSGYITIDSWSAK